MSTRTNAIFLSDTAMKRLQMLVNSEEFSTVDDAASHLIVANTGQPTPVFSASTPVDLPLPPTDKWIKPDNDRELTPGEQFLSMAFD